MPSPYIWHKRLLAGEMQRVVTGGGVILMPHLHSAHGDNYSAGDTLSPAAYSNLFAALKPRVFDDRMLLGRLLDERVVDLASHTPPAACGDTPSITLVASRDAGLYRDYAAADPLGVTGVLAVNPSTASTTRTASRGSRSPFRPRSTRTSSRWPSGTCRRKSPSARTCGAQSHRPESVPDTTSCAGGAS